LQPLARPIPSLRWRRIAFIHTTWDRLQDAGEINDLFMQGEQYVDRLYATLKEKGVEAVRNYRVEEPGVVYELPLAVICQDGRIEVRQSQLPQSDEELINLADEIAREAAVKGGVITVEE
jgi:hypothetical protein